MLSGSYPTFASGHGWVAMVCSTASVAESITDTVSLLVLATNTVPFLAYSAVGWRPTSMLLTAAAGFAVSMTLTVPVVLAPVTGLAGTWVPYEFSVVSPVFAVRPP